MTTFWLISTVFIMYYINEKTTDRLTDEINKLEIKLKYEIFKLQSKNISRSLDIKYIEQDLGRISSKMNEITSNIEKPKNNKLE